MENVLNDIIQYSNDILNDKIPACVKHKWACQRFLTDLENQNTEKFPYIFDEEKATKFLKFMTLFKHRKGVLAGQYIDPHIIQKFIFGNIYGWIHKDTRYRRFRKSYWQTSRKQAKSQTLGIQALYELSAFGEQYSEVYVAATKKDQAKIVFTESDNIYKANKYLKDKFKTAYNTITHIKSNSIMRALSKDDSKTGDGLNCQLGILDEYHAHKTSEYYDILESGMISRTQPLMSIITTAGFELSYPCYRVEYKYVSNILNPSIDIWNDSYFIMINEYEKDDDGNIVDDIMDESLYLKANPIAASYPEGLESLRLRAKDAMNEPEKMRDVLTKNFNIWCNLGEAKYMNMDKWKLAEDKNISIYGKSVYVGVDLSATLDLTSLSFVVPDGNDGFVELYSHSFIPEDTFFAKCKSDKVPYKLWSDQGWITVLPGAEIDNRLIIEWLQNFEKEQNIHINEIDYDDWNAHQFALELYDLGYIIVDIGQTKKKLSEPTKKLRGMIYNKQARHNGNPCLTWAMSNAVLDVDNNENIKLDKKKSVERIDPAASLITAFVRAGIGIEKKSCYDGRKEGKKLFDY